MRALPLHAAVLAASLLMALPLRAGDAVTVVTHPDSPLAHLSREDVAALFLGERSVLADGRPVVPLDLDDENVRADFYAQAANRSLMQIRAYWARMVFTGNGRPPKSLPLDALQKRLATDPRTVAYVPAGKSAGLKVLLTLPAP